MEPPLSRSRSCPSGNPDWGGPHGSLAVVIGTLAILVLSGAWATSVASMALGPAGWDESFDPGHGSAAAPSFAMGGHTTRTAIEGACGDCAYYLQEGATIEGACFSGVSASCTSYAGYSSIEEDVAVPSSPYPTGFELNGYTNTGDWFQMVIGENWCDSGFALLVEAWNNADQSVYGPTCVTNAFSIAVGDVLELGLNVSSSGGTSGDVCLSAADLTNPQGAYVSCIAQPDPGTTPASNYFSFGGGDGYFTGPMTEIYDASASSCERYASMPEVTYQFVAGAYVTEFVPWSDEWDPATATVCYSTTSGTAWTQTAADASVHVADAAGASALGPHWEAAQNTSASSSATWWAFSTDYLSLAPTATPSSVAQGSTTTVTFSDPIVVQSVDGNTTYFDWHWNATVLTDCATESPAQTMICSVAGVAGPGLVYGVFGESGGASQTTPTSSFEVTADLVAAAPTTSRPSADAGQSVTYSAHASGGYGTLSYVWAGLPYGCAGTAASVRCAGVAGTYTFSYTATDSDNASATSPTTTFTILPEPSASTPVANRSSVDVGQWVQFSASGSGGSGGLTYAWSGLPPGCTGTATTVDCQPTAPVSGASVELLVTDSNGATVASDPLAFSVYSLPSVRFASGPTSVLSGQSWTAVANVTGGSGGWVYSWAGLPTGCATSATDSVSCAPSVTGTYTVSVTVVDGNGGDGVARLTVTVAPSFLGLPMWEGILLVGAGVLVILGVVLAVRARRRPRP